MQEPTLRDVFKVSWKLTKNYKGLWILGAFALVLGQLGILDVITAVVKGVVPGTASPGAQMWYIFSPDTLLQIGNTLGFSFDSWAAFAWLLVMILALGIALIVVGSIAQGGMVHATALSMEHGLKSMEKFEESWHAGARNVSYILVLNIVKKCIIFAVSVIVSASAFAALFFGTAGSMAVFVLSFISAVIVGMTVSVLTIFAVGYLVIEKKDLFDSIKHAWKLLIKHWVVSFEVGVVLILLNLVVFALLLAGLYVFVAPSLALSAYGALTGNIAVSQFGVSIAVVLFLAYALIIGSMFTVFVNATWTYLFVIMHRWGLRSRVHAWFTGFKRT
ncbi:MAG: hypothetical protein KBD29_03720 [Candidatus Magasanikbacteria bacterium]|nr:hypothetical protein [Candidatus Magasanikbacteria bacterium]